MKWLGSKKCDVCCSLLSESKWFADCRIRVTGRTTWAVVCEKCHAKLAISQKFGPGIGQKYDSKTFEKLEG